MKLDYSIKEICNVCNASILGYPNSGDRNGLIEMIKIDVIRIDSRKIKPTESTLFVAITTGTDGHNYIEHARLMGAKYAIVSNPDLPCPKEITFLLVDDTLAAFQKIAAFHRSQFEIPIIGITGSNGKTTVKEWLYNLTANSYSICRSPKSYNSQIGVPLSILELTGNHELGIFEVGISSTNEMEKLRTIVQPTLGIFTGLGPTHDNGFASRHEKLLEKLILFKNCKFLMGGLPNQLIETIQKAGFQTIDWSEKVSISTIQSGTTISFNNQVYKSELHDPASVQNLSNAIVCADQLGVKNVQKGIDQCHALAMRLEILPGKNGITVINDSYSLDIQSLEIALSEALEHSKGRPIAVVLSDLPNEDNYPELKQLLSQFEINSVIGIGSSISQHIICDQAFNNTEKAILSIEANQFSNQLLLVKGTRKFKLEKLVRRLQLKNHDTRLTVDLTAIRKNISVFRSILQPETKIMVMLKAAGYGMGGEQISSLLEYENIDYLGVAFANEGVELRKVGCQLPIMVLNASEDSFDDIIEYQLEPEIYSLEQLDAFIHALIAYGISDHPIHLKLETGMNRLGFTKDDLRNLIDLIRSQPEVEVVSCFSHLAASDDRNQNAFSIQQINSFSDLAKTIDSELGTITKKHILNSNGISEFREAHFDMVRLGIGLHGIGVVNQIQDKLSPSMQLTTTISQIKQINPGDSIGYNRKGELKNGGQIAIIPIGYADGFSRGFSNGVGSVWINGCYCPVIGNVCMDMTMIDVSSVDASIGDEVEIFGAHISVEQLANATNTIPYEILTSISPRVNRVYVS